MKILNKRKEFVYFSGRVIRILLFNSTGDREANVLIEPLVVSYEQLVHYNRLF